MKKNQSLISAMVVAGVASLAAPAQALTSTDQDFLGQCTGQNQHFVFQPFLPNANNQIIGGEIFLFQNPTGGIQYALLGINFTNNHIVDMGVGDTHVTSFFPSGSYFTVGAFPQIGFDIACNNGAGQWQATVTIWSNP